MELVFFYLVYLLVGYALLIYLLGVTVMGGYFFLYFCRNQIESVKQRFLRSD
ncbi:hypothetical protein [Bacillus seohaeanensis]|uniref:DUF4083 domain-containing protein n=1 Tax=Bacillus seohaeanensis TaxID=284580 RepID=A0ABW5RUI2_9BACI